MSRNAAAKRFVRLAAWIAAVGGIIEPHFVADEQRNAACRLHIAVFPRIRLTPRADERRAIRAEEMESVTARRQNQFRQFRFGRAFADLVRRALQNLIEAEHDAFVGIRIKIVKFREGIAGTIHYVRSSPIDGLAFLPAA